MGRLRLKGPSDLVHHRLQRCGSDVPGRARGTPENEADLADPLVGNLKAFSLHGARGDHGR